MLQSYLHTLLLDVDRDDFATWRERVLALFLFGATVMGAAVAVPSILLAVSKGLWSVALADLMAVIWVACLAGYRSLSYRARAWNLCLLLYLLGLALLLAIGAPSQIYLLAVPVLAALMIGLRASLLAMAVNALTLPLVGYWTQADFPIAGFDATPLMKWVVITLNFSFVSALISFSCVLLLKGLEKAFAKRRDSEERYRTLIEWTPAPLAVHDGTRFIYANPAAVALFGARQATDLIGKPLFELVHPDSHSAMQAQLTALAQADGVAPSSEQKLLQLDGSVIHAEVTSAGIVLDGANAIQVAIHDITERKAAQQQVQQLAFSDPLTGLPNRRLFLNRLQQALAAAQRHQRQGALVFVDLDNFKSLNETLGQELGDQLLRHVAAQLGACVRDGDTVARLGGDEFVMLLEDLGGSSQEAATHAEAISEKALQALRQRHQLGTFQHHGSASIGITLFGNPQEISVDPLIQAEMAMYQAKSAGRNMLRFYDPQMQTAANHRAALEAALHEALAKEQFCLHYQGQVDETGRFIGAEALLRWLEPSRGLVPPAEFIALAEETGLILPIGAWVLQSACNELARWSRQPGLAHLTLAVNVSARQFRQADFVDQVLRALERSGAPADRLKLELTESLLVSEVDAVIAKMHALKQSGLNFALDDFGTGYSSLSILKQLPLDQLKIDQSFVRDILDDPNDAAIASMVIALANSMGLSVIAEGVESSAQRDLLATLGCQCYQGYLFARPLPVTAFEALVLPCST